MEGKFKQMNTVKATKGKNILIFAPHNDDEILGTGGIIQDCVDSDVSVKVAILTNGDGQIRRPNFLPFFRADFVKLGYKRQKESIDALEYLGLGEEDVEFFGYPDRGLSKMWTTNWTRENSYYSKYTKTNRSPYDNSFTENVPYCGSAAVEDVMSLISKVNPDVIYLPHPNDTHPDHWATNGLVLYGLERLKNQGDEDFQGVSALNYLVHSVNFPFPRGKFLESSLRVPPYLEDIDTDWIEVPLDLKKRLRKFRAIGKYRTQTQLMRKYLVSFARANELFGVVPELSLKDSTAFKAKQNLPKDFILEEGEKDKSLLSYLNPKRRSRLASLRRYPDIKSVNLRKGSKNLELAIDFYNRYRSGNEIRISLKTLGKEKGVSTGKSYSFRFKKDKLYHDGDKISKKDGYNYSTGAKSYRLSLPLEEILNPHKLILSTTLARKGRAFARSANRIIELN